MKSMFLEVLSTNPYMKINKLLLAILLIFAAITIENGISFAQSPPDAISPPSNLRIDADRHKAPNKPPPNTFTPTTSGISHHSNRNADLNATSNSSTRPQREIGPFYETRTNVDEKDFNHLPNTRLCGAIKKVRIDLIGTNLFTATFFSNSKQVGNPFRFQRHWFGPKDWIGGAKISERRCSVGVVVDGGNRSSADYEIKLIDAETGFVLSPDGANFYPKLNQSSGILYVEPSVWFSQGDTVAMIIAAAPKNLLANQTENILAHFIDLTTGSTIEKVYFRWPQKSVSLTPYSAEMFYENNKFYILFSFFY
jgi:hypothetical protein